MTIKEEQIEKKFTNFAIDNEWSVALLLDGRLVNRYSTKDKRYAPTKRWIASLERMTEIYGATITDKDLANTARRIEARAKVKS